MATVIGCVSQERSRRSFQLFQQWPDVKGVVNLLIRQVKSDDFITAGVDADMKLAPRRFEVPCLSNKPFDRSYEASIPWYRRSDAARLLQNEGCPEPTIHKPCGQAAAIAERSVIIPPIGYPMPLPGNVTASA
jgi:hypothetical protein